MNQVETILSSIPPIDIRAELFKNKNFDFIVKREVDGVVKEHKKQRKALEVLTSNKYSEFLFGGAANGAKTWTGCSWLLFMAILYPETRWFVARNELRDLEGSVLVTFKKVCKMYGFTDYKYNAVKHYITFGNGSVINFIEIKYKPSDPLFEDLGSTEYTGGWIEEVGEIHEVGAQVISKRAGRHMNDHYGIKKIIFYTCNPKKNWAKREFYDKWKKGELEPHKFYLPSLVQDNPFREKGSAEDLESYKHTNKVLYERLFKGNWDYEDNPFQLTEDEMIDAMFENDHVGTGKRYITADVARFGSDKARIGYWEGWILREVISLDISKTTDIELAIRTFRHKYKIPRTRAIADADGVGCIHPNTEVLTSKGWKKGKYLKKSDYLISKNEEGFIEHKRPTDIHHLENEKFIKTDSGYFFTETHAHFYKTRKEHKTKTAYWDDITELKAFYNDTHIIPSKETEGFVFFEPTIIKQPNGGLQNFGNSLKIEKKVFCKFLGWMSSDGCLDGWNNKYVIRISQSTNSPNCVKIESILDKMEVNWIKKTNKSGRLNHYDFQNKNLFEWIRKNCYSDNQKINFETKKVPDFIKMETKENIMGYVNSFLDGDGYFHKGAMQFTGTNKILLDGIQEVLFYCGIRTKFHIKHRNGSFGCIDGRNFQRTKDCYLLSEIFREKLIKIGDIKEFNDKAINIFLGNKTKAYLVRMNNDIFWTHNGGVVDGAGVKGFRNNARAIRKGKDSPNYKNLQVQCLYHLADKINNAEIWVTADLTGKEKDEIKEEMAEIQSKGDPEPDRKLDCKSKADIKQAIGRSPDWRDMMLMRAYFDIKKTTADLTTTWR